MSNASAAEERRYSVGMSLEALAGGWARQEAAAHGSVVVVSNEISGRLRGGTPWTVGAPDGLMMGVIVRPDIDPMQEALLWLCVSLGASEALSNICNSEFRVGWPDTVHRAADQHTCCLTNVTVQLGPGKIEHAILSVRTNMANLGGVETPSGEAPSREELIQELKVQVPAAVARLESNPLELVASFTDRCAIIDERVKVTLLPRGEARGRVTALDPEGFLVLESATGMLERVAPASLRTLELV